VDTPAGGGRADTPAGGGQADKGGGALYYGCAYMLTHAMGGGRTRREPQRGGRERCTNKMTNLFLEHGE
jgi:hypothetical protein